MKALSEARMRLSEARGWRRFAFIALCVVCVLIAIKKAQWAC